MESSARLRLIFFIAAAFVIDYIPLINLPLLWSQTFFHEISHGLSALLTGGKIHFINLRFNGSGLCTTSGGIQFIIAFSGYAGSAVWGLVIYLCAGILSSSNTKIMTALMVAMLAVTAILWARDIATLIILAVLLMMYTLPLYQSLWFGIRSFIQLVGIYVLLESIRSPLYLLDGRNIGDGAALAQLSWIPEIVWVCLWFFVALSCLLLLWQLSNRKPERKIA